MPLKLLNKLKDEIINIDSDIYREIYADSYDEFYNNESICSKELENLYNHILNIYENKEEKINFDILDKALKENFESTMKILFFSRDIKDGLGMRSLFKEAIKYIGNNYNEDLNVNYIKSIPIYGRFDDLYSLFDTPLEKEVLELFREQINLDLNNDNPSNLGKWLKSINTSSEESRRLARKTADGLNLSYEHYRKTLSILRSKIGVLETDLSENKWNETKYGDVPSLAYNKYKNAFKKNDNKRFSEYKNINNLNLKEENLNINVFINILNNIFNEDYKIGDSTKYENSIIDIIDKNNLESENYITAITLNENDIKNKNRYLLEALSFSLFYLYNNTGRFKNYIIKTKDVCNLKKIKAKDILEKTNNIINNSCSSKINIESILDLILFAAIKHNINDEDLPSGLLLIVHDIKELYHQNLCSSEDYISFYNKIHEKWKDSNYTLPEIKVLILNKGSFKVKEINDNFKIIQGSGNESFKFIINSDNDIYKNERFKNLNDILTCERYKLK
ncbi:hypothetical protein J2Z53_000025 [Clostridium moniliforme]|uniref:Uncharacterized protein n=1 Tax=Clostridium moniliforme TaxID=39489 RepID=A0ABS4EWR5_9CLOT|nr:DUF2828 family protein [Clostridium moniliforme]MBP1888446.1 hypothetical protein [Clostridium moniliforme]